MRGIKSGARKGRDSFAMQINSVGYAQNIIPGTLTECLCHCRGSACKDILMNAEGSKLIIGVVRA